MTMHTANGSVEFNTKSGKGLRDGVVSELTAFFDVKPGLRTRSAQ